MSEATHSPPPYTDSHEHLVEEADWIRALVRDFLKRQGRLPGSEGAHKQMARGFAVQVEELESLLGPQFSVPRPEGESDLVRVRIDKRVERSQQQGIRIRLQEVCDTFGLDYLSRLILTLVLLGEIDSQIRRLFIYAWDDFSRKSPSIEFLLGLLQPSLRGKLVNAHSLFSSSELLRHGLVEAYESVQGPSYLARDLRVAPSVVAYCLGGMETSPILQACLKVQAESRGPTPLFLDPKTQETVANSLGSIAIGGAAVAVIIGSTGVGKSTLIQNNIPQFIEVDVDALMRPVELAQDRIIALSRDARLLQLPIVLNLADASDDPSLHPFYRLLARAIENHPNGAVVVSHGRASFFIATLSQVVIHEIPLPDKGTRALIWERTLRRVGLPPEARLLEAASRFPLSGGAIERAARTAVANLSLNPKDRSEAAAIRETINACRAQLAPRLSGVASRIVTTLTWDDLVLPEKESEAIREIIAYMKNSHRVYQGWGFERLVPYGRGLSVLFAGPPGTGKTMAAGILGGELGMDVFRVDLSQMVSKYIGETEKNLGAVFDEAAKSQSVLLFDEADSLFAKRTDVKSSVDRYANLEVNYLLQRIEDFDGVAILTTNFEGSIDEAFRRRIKFRVHFPAPDETTRANLWRKMMPSEAEQAEEIAFDLLGEDYELSGGHIKNAVVRAAFSAAERGEGIRMRDLRRAARLEAEKLGRLVRVNDDVDEAEDDLW